MALDSYCRKHQIVYIVGDISPDWEREILAGSHCPLCRIEWLNEHPDIYDCICQELEISKEAFQEYLEKFVISHYRGDAVNIASYSMTGTLSMPLLPGAELSLWDKVCKTLKEWGYRIRFAWRVLRYGDVD